MFFNKKISVWVNKPAGYRYYKMKYPPFYEVAKKCKTRPSQGNPDYGITRYNNGVIMRFITEFRVRAVRVTVVKRRS